MKNGEKITRKELEKKGWKKTLCYGDSLVFFGKENFRVGWDKETEQITVPVYSIK